MLICVRKNATFSLFLDVVLALEKEVCDEAIILLLSERSEQRQKNMKRSHQYKKAMREKQQRKETGSIYSYIFR